jgi:hypothetical protein
MDSERISASEAATVAATGATSEARIEIVAERRPAYSATFRARVVTESSAPGVRRQQPDTVDVAAEPPVTFIPDGIVGQSERAVQLPTDVHGTPASDTDVSTASGAVSRRPRTAVACRDREERLSIIEIDIAGGTTLRVDARVDDGALRRVLAVLRSLS